MEEVLGPAMAFVFMFVYLGFMGLMMVFVLASLALSALAVYDCARRDFPDPSTRALWCLLILLTRWLGALIYYLMIYRPNSPPRQAPKWAAAPSFTPATQE